AVAQQDPRLLQELAVKEHLAGQSLAAVTSLTWALLELKAYDAVITMLRPGRQGGVFVGTSHTFARPRTGGCPRNPGGAQEDGRLLETAPGELTRKRNGWSPTKKEKTSGCLLKLPLSQTTATAEGLRPRRRSGAAQ